jgi:hypothetical protein
MERKILYDFFLSPEPAPAVPAAPLLHFSFVSPLKTTPFPFDCINTSDIDHINAIGAVSPNHKIIFTTI